MSPARFRVAAFYAASLFLSSGALAQRANPAASTSGTALPQDIIGGSIYSPDGVTHIVGDGMSGGFIFDRARPSTFVSNGMGAGTLYAPNSTGVMIRDGIDGGAVCTVSNECSLLPSRERQSPRRPE